MIAEPQQKPAILIVDDEPRILDSIRSLLEESFEVVSSTDALEALEVLRTARFAVILADQRMPGLTGDQFLARAQELSEATRILITGYADVDALIRAVNEGQIFNYVPKPWEPSQLRVTVLKAAEHAMELAEQRRAADEVIRQQKALAQSEEAYRRKTEILQSILDSMGDGVIVSDETGKILLINPTLAQMVGADAINTPRVEWANRYGILHPDMTTPCMPDELPLARAMRGETVDGMELYVRNELKPLGIFVSINLRPLKDDNGNIKGGVAVVRDVTEAKRSQDLLRRTTDEAERANHAKSEFLSRMSHELRTPLNSILGFAQLLELGDLQDEQRDSIAQIMNGGQHLLSLINEVLDLAKIEAGRLSLSAEPVHLQEVLQESLNLVRPLAQQRNISIRNDAGADTDGHHVKADRQRLRQVLLNLLSNAVKYNKEGGTIEVGCEERESGWLRLSVTDSGPGISEGDQEKLFRPFGRVGEESLSIEGTGLGLALSRGLMDAMGGRIGVNSTPDQGSTFWLELMTVSDATGASEISDAIHAELPAHNWKPSTILYIEDNPANLTLMERILALRTGVSLMGAAEGRSGIYLAKAHNPDLILLDLHLPDLSGDDVLQALKAEPATQSIPVAILSADATPGQVERLLSNGAQSYLTKPLDIASVLRLVDEVCGTPGSDLEKDRNLSNVSPSSTADCVC